jgi:hypothetical protein
LRLVSAEQVAAEHRRKHVAKLMRPTLMRFGVIK